MNNIQIETERKFLIRIPSISDMESQNNFRIRKMVQTYLQSDGKRNARVREVTENGQASYIKTVKERISTLSCYEDEGEISKEEYETRKTALRPFNPSLISKYEREETELDIGASDCVNGVCPVR